jgi:hypothetical protein
MKEIIGTGNEDKGEEAEEIKIKRSKRKEG